VLLLDGSDVLTVEEDCLSAVLLLEGSDVLTVDEDFRLFRPFCGVARGEAFIAIDN